MGCVFLPICPYKHVDTINKRRGEKIERNTFSVCGIYTRIPFFRISRFLSGKFRFLTNFRNRKSISATLLVWAMMILLEGACSSPVESPIYICLFSLSRTHFLSLSFPLSFPFVLSHLSLSHSHHSHLFLSVFFCLPHWPCLCLLTIVHRSWLAWSMHFQFSNVTRPICLRYIDKYDLRKNAKVYSRLENLGWGQEIEGKPLFRSVCSGLSRHTLL